MSIADSFKNFTKTIFSNPMGNTKAGTWNVLPAVLSTWSDLIQLRNQTAPDTYALYKKQAKEYIKNSVNLYWKKDEFGEYRVPVVRQRPIFLLGAPGIGKTAIMEQIAQELGIALVS